MKILVTGGAGFVGTNLLKKLKIEFPDAELLSLDCYFTGKEENHIAGVKYITNYTWNINDIFKDETLDVIYHFGEYSRIVHSFEDIEFVSKSICHGTIEVLNYCIKNKTKLIYSASSSKFGNNGEDEKLSPYAFFKSKIVETIKQYGKWFDLQYEIAYFFNVYGPYQIYEGKYATVIAIFEKQYKNGEPLTVVEPGIQSRDFTHVNDIIDGLILLSSKNMKHEWHLRSGQVYTILDVVKMFNSDYKIIPARRGERFSADKDQSDTREKLNWQPKEKLSDWIKLITK